MPRRAQLTILFRLLGRMVHRVDECWIYPGYCNTKTGYGNAQFDGQRMEAHTATYRLLIGPVPEGLELDHLCRVRACCNPLHLEPVTHRVNLLRGESPAAHQAKQTHCLHGHPLSGDNLVSYQRGKRLCRICMARRAAEWREKIGHVPTPRRTDQDTHCRRGHARTAENTYRYPNGTRECRLCSVMHKRAFRSRHSPPPEP